MGLLARGQALLNRLRKQDGVAVTYSRGSGPAAESVPLTCWVAGTRVQAEEAGGVVVQWGERDYMVAVADLVLGGIPTTPQKGDRLAEAVSGQVWELVEPRTLEAAWRYSDHTRLTYRVHAKRVK